MESKANILYANVGSDESKVSLSFFITDVGSVESAEGMIDELNEVVKKHGGSPKT